MFATSYITLNQPSIGRSPAGFMRMHVELPPRQVGALVGYDPRVLVQKPRRTAKGTKKMAPVPHNVAPKIVALQNQVQRSIDGERVAAMVRYLHTAVTTGAFADWGSIEVVTTSRPEFVEEGARMDTDADYFIADGQHRYCAILDFVREYPEHAERFTQEITISVLPQEKLEEWAGQAFHDRNYFAVGVRAGKALAVDSRDALNAVTKDLAKYEPIIRSGGIAYERDTLLKGDPRLTTHSVLHRFVKGFIFGRPGLEKSTDALDKVDVEQEQNLREYVWMLADALPWDVNTPDRDQYLSRASVVLSALSVVGHDLYETLSQEEISSRIARLRKLDWRRTNLEWVGVLGTERDGVVQPASSRPAIDTTIRYFRELLGVARSPQLNGKEKVD